MKKRIMSLLLVAVMVFGMVLQLAPSAQAATTVTVTDSAGVNMRDGAGTSYNKVIGIPVDTVLTVQKTQEADGYTWGKVTYDGKTGWIALEFTDYNSNQTEPTPPASNGTWKQEGGKWYYYINGQKKTGWIADQGKWYYLDGSGVMQTGWVRYYGSWYYLNANGVMQTGWVKSYGNWYYMNDDGIMQTGWVTVGGASYYLNADGIMQTGWIQQGSTWYYLFADGKMATGRVLIDDKISKFDTNGKWLGYAKYMTSQNCIDLLKLEEGFSLVPYWDFTQWTVGFGTRCPDGLVDYYKANGITTAEAETLLREYLMETEASIEGFIDRYSLNLTAQQFDALVLFSYNCGSSWVSETTGTFHTAIKSGATGSELIRAFVLWSSAGGEIKDFLVRRRLTEVNMYLNGVYSQTPPSDYGYVLYDANGGTVSFRIQGFDAKEGVAPYTPTHATKSFSGWYTAKEGGTKVTTLSMAQNGKTLYARWGTVENNNETPSASSKKSVLTIKTEDGPLNVRQGPGVGYDKVTTLNNGDQVILLETKTVGNYVWGRYDVGWIRLDYTDYNAAAFGPAAGWVNYYKNWYYYKDGAALKNWHQLGGKWYFFDYRGVMAENQWRKDYKGWCYLGADGAMMTNAWVKDSKGWCYVGADGYCLTNQWIKDSVGWIWLDSEGSMAKDQWVYDGGAWYYLDKSGYMATGWIKYKNNWYYLNDFGMMKTGWLEYANEWYYLHNNGVMATGTIAIGPVTYKFDANGIWLG